MISDHDLESRVASGPIWDLLRWGRPGGSFASLLPPSFATTRPPRLVWATWLCSNEVLLGGRGRLVAEQLAFTIEPLCRKWAAVWPEVARGIHRCFNKSNLCPVD